MGEVDYTNSILQSVMNGWMDRQTVRQGQILMPLDYPHRGIKMVSKTSGVLYHLSPHF